MKVDVEEKVLVIFLIWAVVATIGCFSLSNRLRKAETCNKAFVYWFYYNQGVTVDLDALYEDAVKWVNDPQYIPERE